MDNPPILIQQHEPAILLIDEVRDVDQPASTLLLEQLLSLSQPKFAFQGKHNVSSVLVLLRLLYSSSPQPLSAAATMAALLSLAMAALLSLAMAALLPLAMAALLSLARALNESTRRSPGLVSAGFVDT